MGFTINQNQKQIVIELNKRVMTYLFRHVILRTIMFGNLCRRICAIGRNRMIWWSVQLPTARISRIILQIGGGSFQVLKQGIWTLIMKTMEIWLERRDNEIMVMMKMVKIGNVPTKTKWKNGYLIPKLDEIFPCMLFEFEVELVRMIHIGRQMYKLRAKYISPITTIGILHFHVDGLYQRANTNKLLVCAQEA